MDINQAAKEFFGISYLFPYQRLVISNILAGGEAPGRQIVILPTGAGKSLCFQLPAMLLEGNTLVIYPILGLMADQERRMREQGLSAIILRGGQSRVERDEIWQKIQSKEAKFIIANPEVLLTEGVFGRLKDLNLKHIVVDEAHCVSEWGLTFRPAYLEIGRIIRAAGSPLITAFTATAGREVLEKIEHYIFGDDGALKIVGNPDRKNISYSVFPCIVRDLAVRDLIKENKKPAIVFCSSRPGTELLARYLRIELNTESIRFYHAGLSREEKKETEDWFFLNTDAVLVTTCAYGMGIDKADIRTIIHRDCPPSVEAYLQESGRAGRDGKPSVATLLAGPGGKASRGSESLRAYTENTKRCRREALLDLLGYEGEKDSPGTDCCDVCANKAREELREAPALIDFFRRNRRIYTALEAAAFLAGAKTIDWSQEQASEAIDYLIQSGRLRISKNTLWNKKII
ncbi:MAG: RecQ family ATP-dependent DNA helicase [Treponema sp.]|nr:RecQ family ATP-dependent DNA helicase [Treponema sp.]